MKYKVDFTPQALEDISKLDRIVIERIIESNISKATGHPSADAL